MVVTFETENVGSFRVDYNPDPEPLSVEPGALPNRVNKDIVLPREGLDLSSIEYDHITASPGYPFDSLIEYLNQTMTMQDKGSSLRDTVGADFVTSRAILRELSVLPFNDPGTKIWAQRHKGVIFLWKRESKPDKPLQADDAKKIFAAKYKFKFYMTLDENGHARDTTKEKANNRVSFKGVFRATVKNDARKHEEAIKVFYTSPVDSIDEDGKFINIKTKKKDKKVEESRHIPDSNWWKNYSHNAYVDAVLINSPYTIFGNKTFNLPFIVYQIEEKSTEDIPRDIPENDRQWTREGCLESLSIVLNEIKSRLADEEDALLVSINGRTVTYTTDAPDSRDFLDRLPFDH